MNRLNQLILIGSFIGFSWLGLQVVHELGHVIGAVATGGTVTGVVLYPSTFSRTDVYTNPHPLIEVWAGAVVGVLLPLFAFLLAWTCKMWTGFLFRFFAGFCLIGNGVYIGAGWLVEEGADAWVLVQNGSPVWSLVLFGLCTVPLGLYLWHGQGSHFGLGDANGRVDRRAAVVSAGLFVAMLVIELLVGAKG